MFELIQHIPEPWRQPVDVLMAPLAWIPRMQHMLWDFFFAPGPLWLVVAKYLFLVFPALLAIAAVWCDQIALYKLPFRSGRVQFIPTMMLTWWDAVRAVWLFWVGMFRFVGVALGWAVAFGTFVAKLVLEVIRQIALMPFTMTGRMTQSYFTPGVPWFAFGWIGIRGMTWFLFGQYGTPSMLAFISRKPMMDEGHVRPANAMPAPTWWRQPVTELKQEVEWLHAKSEELLDYLVLPVLQVAAAALNFGMVLVASRQVFSLPFKDRSEITQTWHILQNLHVQAPPRKQATL